MSDSLPEAHVTDENNPLWSPQVTAAKVGDFQLFNVRHQLAAGKNHEVTFHMRENATMVVTHTVKRSHGEKRLHTHQGQDAVWLVVRGQAQFHDSQDHLVATLNPYDAIFIPGGTAYWFVSTAADDLEVVRISAKRTDAPNQRLDFARPGETVEQVAEILRAEIAAVLG
jgi:mannose-6-phosphate isomerase-like protein (cupin superfamily)